MIKVTVKIWAHDKKDDVVTVHEIDADNMSLTGESTVLVLFDHDGFEAPVAMFYDWISAIKEEPK